MHNQSGSVVSLTTVELVVVVTSKQRSPAKCTNSLLAQLRERISGLLKHEKQKEQRG